MFGRETCGCGALGVGVLEKNCLNALAGLEGAVLPIPFTQAAQVHEEATALQAPENIGGGGLISSFRLRDQTAFAATRGPDNPDSPGKLAFDSASLAVS
jgi:hypothetical protein